ncbi:MAG: hypothetical protein ACI8TQ_002003, partial [Planctomycetota bacterium]
RIIHEHADQTPRTTGTAGRSWCLVRVFMNNPG